MFGICAGLILLFAHSDGEEDYGLGTMDIRVKRMQAGDDVEILASVDGHIVAARHRDQMATASYPELTRGCRVIQPLRI